jgi:ATP phosphoribosyltransferase
MLRIAIPKKANNIETCLQHFQAIGINHTTQNDYKAVISKKFPAEVRKMDYKEIITAFAEGVQDIGVVMQHHIAENSAKVLPVHSFPACKKNVSLFISKELRYKNIESLTGKRIATPFPNIVSAFFKTKNVKVTIVPVNEEVMCALELGIADAVCTISDFEPYNFESQLREIEVVTPTFPIIIANENLSAQKQMILDELIERMVSVQNADGKKMIYITVSTEKQSAVKQALTQAESPLIELPAAENKTVFQCVLDEKQLWDIKTHLQIIGAESIFVLPIENVIR